MSRLSEDKALAIVFANTRRKKRTENLMTVAEAFEHLAQQCGSQKSVAEKVGLSSEMVREFRRLLGLPPEIQELVRSRKIDRLDVAYRLSMVSDPEEQLKMAREAAGLITDDLRDLRHLVQAGSDTRKSKRVLERSKLRDLNVFVLDFEHSDYAEIRAHARKAATEPAQLLKDIITRWLRRHRRSTRARE